MRHTFTNKRLPHVWIYDRHKYDPNTRVKGSFSSRVSKDSMFFEGDMIFSWGYHFPIAWVPLPDAFPELVLVNDQTYSSSTSKHQSHVRQAIPENWSRINVPDLDRGYSFLSVLHAFSSAVKEAAEKAEAINERTAPRQFATAVQELQSLYRRCSILCRLVTPSKSGLEGEDLQQFKALRRKVADCRGEFSLGGQISQLDARYAYATGRLNQQPGTTEKRTTASVKDHSPLPTTSSTTEGSW